MNRRRVVGGACLAAALGLFVAACNVEPVALGPEHSVAIGGGDTTVALTTLSDGTVVAVGESSTDNSVEVYQERFSSAGDVLPPFNPVQVNAVSGYRQVDPTVVALAGATYAVLWMGDYPVDSSTALFGRVFDSGGNPLTGDVVLVASGVSGSTTGTTAAAPLPGGGLVASWSGVSNSLHAQQFSSTLASVGPVLSVDTSGDGVGQPAVAGLHTGGFAVTWPTRSGTEAQVFNGWDVAQGPQFVAGGRGLDPAVTTGLTDGSFVIVGEDLGPGEAYGANDIEALRFDDHGQPLGAPVPISTPGGPLVNSPAVAPLPNGGYVAGWLESPPGGNHAVMAHRFFANGIDVSPVIQAQPGTSGDGLFTPALTALPGDGFAIWGYSLQFYLRTPT